MHVRTNNLDASRRFRFTRIGLGWVLLAVASCLPWGHAARADEALRDRLNDEHAAGTDLWVYNNIASARALASRQDKPLFVTFRCVPCENCKAFDAEVAQGSQRVRELADKHFVSVRQVEMKGVDLSQFQFDYDLNWAAMFLNADGTVYARYGTQSAAGPDAYNSIEGLLATMQRVLETHEDYPRNAAELRGKLGPKKPYATALEMPGLPNKERYRGTTARNNCIHCHNIHDAENEHAQRDGVIARDMLWRYPLPENIGFEVVADHGRRIASVRAGSPAATAGLEAGQEISHINGQLILSIADMQWVLHHLPNTSVSLDIATTDGQQYDVPLPAGWKETDISWRGSMWSISPKLRVWTPELAADRKQELGLPAERPAYEVRWINTDAAGGKSARDAGLRQGDVVIAVNREPLPESTTQFNFQLKMNYKIGDRLPLTVLRDGRRLAIEIPLVE